MMSRIKFLLLVVVISFISCKEESLKDYITIKGLIANNDSQNIDILSKGFDKRIEVKIDGTFSDTLKVIQEGYHFFNDGKNKFLIHIKNGDVLNIQYDYEDINNSLQFKGVGYETSKYLNERKQLDSKEGIKNMKSFFKLEPVDFHEKVSRIERKFDSLLTSNKIDSALKQNELTRNKQFLAYIKKNYTKENYFLIKFKKGKPSPNFVNYENFKGGSTSLADFKGKFVYIDIWATWCGPCKREIPHFKNIIEEFENDNIEFVSISVDNGRGYKNDADKAKLAWRNMIKEKDMKGVQLYADKAWDSDFIKAYSIKSIPRFILIDPNGNIVNANAPRPSSTALKELLTTLLR